MANAAAGASQVAAPSQAGGGAQNPFQIATNLYAEKNLQGAVSGFVPGTGPSQQGGSVNAGQYLRGVRLQVRTTVAGTWGTAPTSFVDLPWGCILFADLVNVDGSEILYNMNGFAHYAAQKWFRPWLVSPDLAYDTTFQVATSVTGISGTLFLQPEIRFTAGVLANTDTRSQYRFDYTLASGSYFGSGTGGPPTLAVIPYMDAWAQPDGNDLQGTPNQPVPPGVNLQNKRRHQIFTLNGNGSDNILLSTLTGNALRGMLLITRSAGTGLPRVDGFSDPFYWQLDNRSLGRLNPDMIRQWASDFYQYNNRGGMLSNTPANPTGTASASFAPTTTDSLGAASLYTGAGSSDVGVYVFPRWIEPGQLEGQGWLYTANSTKITFESATQNSAATAELISDEVYPVGNVDPSLIDI